MNQCSQQNNGDIYAQKYELILSDIKAKGIKVFHRKIKNGAAGLYDQDKNIITINKVERGTLDGCFYLCHEWSHSLQRRYNEHKEFFSLNIKDKYSDEKMRWIIEAEKDASFKAKRLLKTYGIDYAPQELDPKKINGLIKFWKNHYFDK